MSSRSKVALLTIATLSLSVAAATLVPGCQPSALLGRTTRTSHDWTFVESVGGMTLGPPRRAEDGRVVLPIDCDVSNRNSGLACADPLIRVRAQGIGITLRTQLAQTGGYVARCPEADLGELEPGRYSVHYASPDGSEHPLGDIEVPER